MFYENNEILISYNNNEKWLEYKEMKNKAIDLFNSLKKEKILDIIGFLDRDNFWLPDYNIILNFESKKISLNTKSCYVWIVEEVYDDKICFSKDIDFLLSEGLNLCSIIDTLNLNVILNQSLKAVLVHNKFEYPKDDFFDYSGIILVFDKASLHIFDNGDELGIRLLFEDPNELKQYISDDKYSDFEL